MKKFIGILSVVIVLCTFFVLGNIEIFGYATFNDNVLNGGVGRWGYQRRYYWISPSASSYTTIINTAMSEWINTDHIVRTPKADGTIEFHLGNYYAESTGILGETRFWRYSNSIDPTVENWGWNEVLLNNKYGSEKCICKSKKSNNCT